MEASDPRGDWTNGFVAALNDERKERTGPLVVGVPDDSTLYAIQRLCFSQTWNSCLTARYCVRSATPVGTLLSALAGDLLSVVDGRAAVTGDLLDSREGRHWAEYAGSVVARLGVDHLTSIATGDVLTSHEVDAFVDALDGDEDAEEPRTMSKAAPPSVGALSVGNRLVLLLDATKDVDQGELASLVRRMTRRMALVVTLPSPATLDQQLRVAAPAASLLHVGTSPDLVARATRPSYSDSALASDRAASADELGVEQLALTTARLLLHEGTGPICIGIEAPWGKGKSTFLNLVEKEAGAVTAQPAHPAQAIVVRFNAWTYDSAQDAWAGLAVCVLEAIELALPPQDRLRLRLAYAWEYRRRPLIGWAIVMVASFVTAIALLVVGGRAAVEKASSGDGVVPAVVATFVSPAVLAVVLLAGGLYRLARPVSDRVTAYVSRPDHESRLGYQHRVIADLRFALDWYRGRREGSRIVVMVDDLDRCSEDKVVELVQAVNLVLSECKVYTLLAIDGTMVRRAIYRHHRDSREDTLPEEYRISPDFSSEYLEKIVQFVIQLPPTSPQKRQAYVAKMFVTAPVEPEAATPPGGGEGPAVVDGTTVDGYAIDRSSLELPALVSDVPMADTPAERSAMERYQALLDDNPRELKRAVNLHRFVKLALFRTESPPDEATQRRLVLWVVLCLGRPDIAAACLRPGESRTEGPDEDLLASIDADALAWLTERVGEGRDQLLVSDLPLLARAAGIIRLTARQPLGASL